MAAKVTDNAKRMDMWLVPLADIVVGENAVRFSDPPEDIFEPFYQSILRDGQKTPGEVIPLPNNKVKLVYGHQRYRALKRKEKETGEQQFFRATLFRGNEEEAFFDALSENKDRINPTAMDNAKAMRYMIDHFGKKPEEIAARFGKSPAWVTQHLSLLSLPKAQQEKIHRDALSNEFAFTLAQNIEPELRAETLELAEQIAKEREAREAQIVEPTDSVVIGSPAAETSAPAKKAAPKKVASKATNKTGKPNSTDLNKAAQKLGSFIPGKEPEMKMKEFKDQMQEIIDTEPGTPKADLCKQILKFIQRQVKSDTFDRNLDKILGVEPTKGINEKAHAAKGGKK
jgi:ParB/RepB/Spo0J family partition protein